MLRNYGQEKRYHHNIKGTNSRLDEMQAALLRAKLPLLDSWNRRRQSITARYRAEIRNSSFRFIARPDDRISCEHLFVLRSHERDAAIDRLAAAGVQCLIHYPVPIHLQKAFGDLGYAAGAFPNAEALCDSVFSLPIYPELTDEEVDVVIRAANEA